MQQASLGEMVHYILPKGRSKGQPRPAVVVRVWPDYKCNLQVFTDDSNDDLPAIFWATRVEYSDDKVPGTWRFPSIVFEDV